VALLDTLTSSTTPAAHTAHPETVRRVHGELDDMIIGCARTDDRRDISAYMAVGIDADGERHVLGTCLPRTALHGATAGWPALCALSSPACATAAHGTILMPRQAGRFIAEARHRAEEGLLRLPLRVWTTCWP
jgi:hypothetical protein